MVLIQVGEEKLKSLLEAGSGWNICSGPRLWAWSCLTGDPVPDRPVGIIPDGANPGYRKSGDW